MSGRFLRAAYQVLDLETRPLTASQIVARARERELLHSGGKTPENTMRARLSDSIRAKGADSPFQRVGANRFGLRAWNFQEYHARPFNKELPAEVTVCVPGTIQKSLDSNSLWYSPVPAGFIEYLRDRRNVQFIDRRTAETTSQYKQLIAYVWLESADGRVLSYTRGKYSSAHRTLLLGRRSVGFGGHVLQQDAEGLFGQSDGGLEQAALREIGEELDGTLPTNLDLVGVIWDDSSFEGQKHVGVVMKGALPSSESLQLKRSEQSINQLQLLSKQELWQHFHAMEFWSQLLIREFAGAERPNNIASIVPPRPPKRRGHLALVGEIANGKSWLAKDLSDLLRLRVVSASTVLRGILGIPVLDEAHRLVFQGKALEFIRQERGPDELAKAIAREVTAAGENTCIIDGIRQIDTLNALRAIFPDLIVIYIDCPRDLAFGHYQTRLPKASVLDFSAVREHPVEAELPLFKFEADAVLNNADSKQNSLDLVVSWLSRK